MTAAKAIYCGGPQHFLPPMPRPRTFTLWAYLGTALTEIRSQAGLEGHMGLLKSACIKFIA